MNIPVRRWMSMTICPVCKQRSDAPPVQQFDGKAPGAKVWHCVAYTCPVCNRMLSVQVYPPAPKKRLRRSPQVMPEIAPPKVESAPDTKPAGENPAGQIENLE